MQYRALTVIAHHQFTCQDGAILQKCPPALLKQFLKDKLVVAEGAPDEPMEGFEEAFSDILSAMTREQLLAYMKHNDLGPLIAPRKSWTDEQIRMAIRDVADLGELKVPVELDLEQAGETD